MSSDGLVRETHVMRQEESGPRGLLGPTELIEHCGLLGPIELIKHFPGEPFAASDRLHWVGLEALRYHYQPPNGAFQPPLTHHSLLLFIRAPKKFECGTKGSAGSSRLRRARS